MSNQFTLVGYKLNEEKLLTNTELCRKCRGRECCYHSGCSFSPQDFPVINLKYLRHFIKRGYTSICCYPLRYDTQQAIFEMIIDTSRIITLENLKKGEIALFLKMRNTRRPIIDLPNTLDILDNSGCVMWGKDGCKFPFRKRPKEGRMLMPNRDKCISLYTSAQSAYDWLPYQELLYTLMQEFS